MKNNSEQDKPSAYSRNITQLIYRAAPRLAFLFMAIFGVFACTNDLDLLYQEQQLAIADEIVAEPVEPEPEPEAPWWQDVDTTNTRQDSANNCGPYCVWFIQDALGGNLSEDSISNLADTAFDYNEEPPLGTDIDSLASLLDSLGIPAESTYPDDLPLDSIKSELDEDDPVILLDSGHFVVVVDYYTDSTGNDWWIVVNGLSDNMYDTLDNIDPAPGITTEPNENNGGSTPGGSTPGGPTGTTPVGTTPVTDVRPVKGEIRDVKTITATLDKFAVSEKR